jgi:undecaprenyl-diphosphatase
MAAAAGGALAVAALAGTEQGRGLDRRVYGWLNRDRGRAVDVFFETITELGSIWSSMGAAATVGLAGRRREAFDAGGAAWAMWLAGQGLKKVYRRPRPYLALRDFRLLIAKPNGTSWPSSHPAVLTAFVLVATRDLGVAAGTRTALLATAGAVGASRVVLGVHFPSDVVGGLLLGVAVADGWSRFVSPVVLGPG